MIVESMGSVNLGNQYYGDVAGYPYYNPSWSFAPTAEYISATEKQDWIYAGYLNDTVYGGAGGDWIYADDGYYAGLLPDNYGDDVIYGEDGNDHIVSWTGNDMLDGGNGNDSIETFLGHATVYGGDGNDSVRIYEHGTALVYLGNGLNYVSTVDYIPSDLDSIASSHPAVGSNTVYGGDFGNYITIKTGDNYIYGGSNTDIIDASGYINGGDGIDLITVYGGNSVACGGDGGDGLRGVEFHHTLKGGDGDDIISSVGGKTLLDGGDGDDRIRLHLQSRGDTQSHEITTVIGGAGNDSITSEIDNTLVIYDNVSHVDGYDQITLTGSNSKVIAASDNTFIGLDNVVQSPTRIEISGNGHDGVRIKATDDRMNFWDMSKYTLTDIAGIDLGNQADTVSGSLSSDDIRGRGGNDTISGFEGNDTLYGGIGDDKLYGDAGNDRVYGGSGADTLKGGAGADKFVFSHAEESSLTSYDQILDFSQTDKDRIYLNAIDADTSTDGNQAFLFSGNAEFSHHAGELRTQFDGIKTQVFADVDGDAIADLRIDIIGNHTLLASDFYL